MKQDMYTMELAQLYETQGYFRDAYEIYQGLQKENPSSQAEAGLLRMKEKIDFETDDARNDISQNKQRIFVLLEQWLELIVLQHRLKNYKAIKARLI